LPPLGLARLAAGTNVSDEEASRVLTMTDSLRRELPKMLAEHKQKTSDRREPGRGGNRG
jgi:hypothetical protein